MMKNRAVQAALIGGSIGGALDILFAMTFAATAGVGPVRVLQTVASGALGEASFSGGNAAAALGLALHFAMAWLWAGLFVATALRFPALLSRRVLAGIAFGIVVFLVMRLVVLPLSAYPRPVTFKPLATTLDLLSHTLLFGVPIAFAAGSMKTVSIKSS
jgi:hypothetical protein